MIASIFPCVFPTKQEKSYIFTAWFFSRFAKATPECSYKLIYVFLYIIGRADLGLKDNMKKPLRNMLCTVCTRHSLRSAAAVFVVLIYTRHYNKYSENMVKIIDICKQFIWLLCCFIFVPHTWHFTYSRDIVICLLTLTIPDNVLGIKTNKFLFCLT
jgi:hypothetical protein